jgi:GH15 family glucan-1,4-alpha-glucosidase
MPLLNWAAGRARPSDVLAEQYHPYSGQPISVAPLTWSQSTVMTTVVEYLRKHSRLSSADGNPPVRPGA